MTREEARTALGDRNNLLWGMSKEEKKYYSEALDMAISALSTEGEYIKKSELLQHVTTEELSDFKDCDVIHAEEIDELTTYSFPDSADDNTMEWIRKPHIYGVTYCSKCDYENKVDDTNFCPNCGRKAVNK